MSKQIDDAIAKIRAEMAANTNNSCVQVVGNFLLQHLEDDPESADHLLNRGKTILKSIEAMRTEAAKKKVGNYAVLTDAEGFAIVLDYFKSPEPAVLKEPDASKAKEKATKRESRPKKSPPAKASEQEDDIDFDALLM